MVAELNNPFRVGVSRFANPGLHPGLVAKNPFRIFDSLLLTAFMIADGIES